MVWVGTLQELPLAFLWLWPAFRAMSERFIDELKAGQAHPAQPSMMKYAGTELNKARNFKQWFKKGRTFATLMTGVEQYLLKGNIPWTIHRTEPDHQRLKPAASYEPIAYPKADGKLTFDRLSSVFVSNTFVRRRDA